jgi:hypothetical protein
VSITCVSTSQSNLCFTTYHKLVNYYPSQKTSGKKIEKSIVDIEKLGSLTPELSEAIAACTSATMLEQGFC